MEKLLVVEDEQSVRMQIKAALEEKGSVAAAAGRREAIKQFLQYFPKVVVLGLDLLPDGQGLSEGLRCLEWMVRMQPSVKVIVLAPAQAKEQAYRALADGAYDFHMKPVVPEELAAIVGRALHLCEVEEQSRQLMEALERATAGGEGGVQAEGGEGLLASPRPHQSDGPLHRPLTRSGTGQRTLKEARDALEKNMVAEAIDSCGGNVSRASEVLGVSRPALYDLMKKYGFRFGRTGCRREVSVR